MSKQSPSPSLFLGFLVDQPFQKRLQTANPSAVALMTQGGEAYLESLVIKNRTYLGKRLGAMSDLSAIDSTEKNIRSLVKRITPEDPAHTPSLVVLALS